jgi:hypothetical protein
MSVVGRNDGGLLSGGGRRPGRLVVVRRSVESFLAWTLAWSCLSVSGYHYLVETVVRPWTQGVRRRIAGKLRCWREITTGAGRTRSSSDEDEDEDSLLLRFPCWLPLTTCSRRELDRASTERRYRQLVRLLRVLLPSSSAAADDDDDERRRGDDRVDPEFGAVRVTRGGGQHRGDDDGEEEEVVEEEELLRDVASAPMGISDDTLVHLVRNHEILRRLVSLAMRPGDNNNNNNRRRRRRQTDRSSHTVPQRTALGQQLIRIWSELLALPPPAAPLKDRRFAVSLIVPCYREDPRYIRSQLQWALDRAVQPARIQVLLVFACDDDDDDRDEMAAESLHLPDAFDDDDLTGDDAREEESHKWGQVRRLFFPDGTGRGPCLNFGASRADGAVLAFCHCDTKLPVEWDVRLLETFYPNNVRNDGSPRAVRSQKEQEAASAENVSPWYDWALRYLRKLLQRRYESQVQRHRASVCAFGFGIDTSPDGLGGSMPAPPGIRAVEVTANLRCLLWSLPYGDQCLCLPATHFRHVGGFPHQCFMEDYDLIAFFRRRSALLSRFAAATAAADARGDISETVAIVSGPPALCSPRRWQKFGVLYVTYTNSKLVNLYAGGLYPDEIYRRYYGQALPVATVASPWERELETLIEDDPKTVNE